MSLGLGVGYYGLGGEDMASGVSTDLKQATSGAAAGLRLWLKNNTDVTAAQWKDQSGFDNHAAQSTEGNQATVSGGGLDFTPGESDHYDLASTITISENQGFCIAIVMDQESVSNNTILSKDADDQIQVVDLNRFRIKTNVSTTTTTNFDVSGAFNTGKMLILINRSAGASNRFTLMKNGATLTPDTDTSSNEAAGENPFGFDINVLGTRGDEAQFFDGKILELAFWSRALTAQEIADVNSYLQGIHGL